MLFFLPKADQSVMIKHEFPNQTFPVTRLLPILVYEPDKQAFRIKPRFLIKWKVSRKQSDKLNAHCFRFFGIYYVMLVEFSIVVASYWRYKFWKIETFPF
uniref:Uncharacterized protein n=1 Tax=Romanomermis culicivorax TaxID=13658 RepID=A0A915L1K6_ROMCU